MKRRNKPGLKLTEIDVSEIFTSLDKYSKLAKKYKVSIPLVCMIKTGIRWNRVTNLPYRERRTGDG